MKTNKTRAAYFDRTEPDDLRMCDERGMFQCGGPHGQDGCPLGHTINPYSSSEAVKTFTDEWQLDHV